MQPTNLYIYAQRMRNYISLTRTSKAAMSKLEFTAKEGNLYIRQPNYSRQKTKFENISSTKRNVKVFIMHMTGMS